MRGGGIIFLTVGVWRGGAPVVPGAVDPAVEASVRLVTIPLGLFVRLLLLLWICLGGS